MQMKLYGNMHGAQARARFLELPRQELQHHAPETQSFVWKNDDCILAQEVAYYRPKGGPQDAPRDRGRHFPDLDPLKPRDHAPKSFFVTRKIKDFVFYSFEIASTLMQKICTALGPEHDFRKDVQKPEKVRLRKTHYLQ